MAKVSLYSRLCFCVLALLAFDVRAGEVVEEFTAGPADSAWRSFGAGHLYSWDSGHVNLSWDTDQPNSAFYRPLGVTLNKSNDFSAEFTLEVLSIEAQAQPGYAFEIAVGFFNYASFTNATFRRGTGRHSPNLLEWDYFPDTGLGATVSLAVASTNSSFVATFDFPLEVSPGTYKVGLSYSAEQGTFTATMLRNGVTFGPLKTLQLPSSFSDLAVDSFGILNHFDASPAGRITARAKLERVVLNLQAAAALQLTGRFRDGTWEVSFMSRRAVTYQLERTTDLRNWLLVGEAIGGTGDELILRDHTPPPIRAFYRVRVHDNP